MTQVQFNKSLMCGAVKTYLGGYPDLIEKVPALSMCYAKLSELISSIEAAAEKQASVTKGKTETKLSAQKALRRAVNQVRLHLYAFASSAGREETKAIAQISDTSFGQLRDTEQKTRAKLILEEARKYLPDLQSRGITESTLAALDDAIAVFTVALDDRNSSSAECISAGKHLKKLFTELAVFFRVEMKAAMEEFRSSQPEFFKGYTAVRHTKALGKRTRKVTAKDSTETAATEKDATESVKVAPDTGKGASKPAMDTSTIVKETSTSVKAPPAADAQAPATNPVAAAS